MIKHGKEITITSYYDGSVTSVKHEYEVSILSTKESLLKDMIDALDVVSNNETTRLDLSVILDTKGRYRLIKKWVT